MKFFPLLFLVLSLAHAEPLERDLGQGLIYFRAHALPADLPSPAAKLQALVLDLRYTSASDASAAATTLAAWLKFRGTSAAPVFVLLNADTAPALRRVFAVRHTMLAVVTLGPDSPGYTPDIALTISPDAERHAYDALDHGAVIDSLITENADKPRHDEAAIMRDRANPPADTDDPDPAYSDPSDGEQKSPPAASAAPATIDLSLQRAVQLHRALVALKRL